MDGRVRVVFVHASRTHRQPEALQTGAADTTVEIQSSE